MGSGSQKRTDSKGMSSIMKWEDHYGYDTSRDFQKEWDNSGYMEAFRMIVNSPLTMLFDPGSGTY
jgi:hypothetical protein